MSAAVDDADRLARVTLSRTIEPGDLRVTGLVSELGAGKVLDYLEAAGEVENHWGFALAQELGRVDPAQVLEQAAEQGIRFIVPGDREWPIQLGALRSTGALHDRGGEPVGLWVRGAHELRGFAGWGVAVVGSRAATSYGTEQATELSRDLAAMGHTFISGLAYGVDQAAHRGALLTDSPAIAVLPGGVDRPYPAAHAQLLEAIAERGLVVSEAPPGAGPTRTRFLARNRIVAGLAEGTVVVEGAVRSGAINTAHWTTNLHRPVMGVPGPVSSAASAGVNQLIRLGQASMVTTAQNVITDVMTHAARAATGAEQLDESFVTDPVRYPQSAGPGLAARISAPRR
ncbi:DNA-processing protein DprA [Pimelobacter simplex]|uniref:DNA-processing protein DprA n=1 Tax=Nocardioides simplex TaxID=2045 RepID=UPI00214F82A7|nr:DNA-processing protein DprA [Pimelobacter simplex]UUW88617.1 DNA-processing protein DprA [Pimelobacter simplex]UUW98122.1 DNA-processing protein DprA [Pimelobacter simplex]